MSPASAGALEVERYIGACLISQNRSKNSVKNREFYQRPQVYPRGGYVNIQGCPTVDGWAGGVPLISFAGHNRRARLQEHDDIASNHLARLAVHTQGAPLILAKSYNHRKSKPQRNNYVNPNLQQTKIFENSNNKKTVKGQEVLMNGSVKGVDAISVTSDESSGSQNSETCLPRIIKPRKRRKKDRKPPHLNRPANQDGFSTDSASPDIDALSFANLSPFLPYFDPFPYQAPASDDKQLLDLFSDLSETPKLHHSFEDVEEAKDVNGNQPASTCQCRYCDPAGQIWDVDRGCYSPFLTPPKTFQFPSLFSSSFTSPISDDYGLIHGMSAISLEDDKYKPSFSRSSSSSSNSSSSSAGDLEVSTEIVTSLNGHRDLEIKFWLNSAVDGKSTKHKESDVGEKT
ncbi:uncharacterized protein LOC143190943 [Rhynchophorus ferrugineus]|uniref:Uncharacterized protein n=1 Tax=Rhynchophorus ferrugineus TaxID=354439 RepID=A0A834M911_RHYFE|nr:hypothetical protein GWI33_017582 [Rhynchophorus ferrugineus]